MKETNLKILVALLCVNLIIYGGGAIADVVTHPQNTFDSVINSLSVLTTLSVTGTTSTGALTASSVTPSDLTASRLVLSDSAKKLASNAAMTTGCLPSSQSSGASLACSNVTDSGTAVTLGVPLVSNGRQMVTGSAPTCAINAGANITAAIAANSSDQTGSCMLTCTNGSCASIGSVTLTFSAAYGSVAPICAVFPTGGGTGSWQPNSNGAQTTLSTTAPVLGFANASVTGGTALASGSTYALGYICFGRV